VSEILTSEQVNEIADAPAGVVDKTIRQARIAQEDPYFRATSGAATRDDAEGKRLSGKSDADRMGVQGSTPSAQVSKAAERDAPQVVPAEHGPDSQTSGVQELEKVARESGQAEYKVKEEKTVRVDAKSAA